MADFDLDDFDFDLVELQLNSSTASDYARAGVTVRPRKPALPSYADCLDVAPEHSRGICDPRELRISWRVFYPGFIPEMFVGRDQIMLALAHRSVSSVINKVGVSNWEKVLLNGPIVEDTEGGLLVFRSAPRFGIVRSTNMVAGLDGVSVLSNCFVPAPGAYLLPRKWLKPLVPSIKNLNVIDQIAAMFGEQMLPPLEPALARLLGSGAAPALRESLDLPMVADAYLYLCHALPRNSREEYTTWRDLVLFPLSHGVHAWHWPEVEAKHIFDEVSALWGGDTANNETQWQAALRSNPDNPITALSVLKKARQCGWRWTFARMMNAGGGI